MKFKRPEKKIVIYVRMTEKNLEPKALLKQWLDTEVTLRTFPKDCMLGAFVYVEAIKKRFTEGPGYYRISIRIPFPSRYYYIKTTKMFDL